MPWITIHTKSGKLVHVNIPGNPETYVKQKAYSAAKSDAAAVQKGGRLERHEAQARVTRRLAGSGTYSEYYSEKISDLYKPEKRRGRGLQRLVEGPSPATYEQGQMRGQDIAKTLATGRHAERKAAIEQARDLIRRANAHAEGLKKGIESGLKDWESYRRQGITKQAKIATIHPKRIEAIKRRLIHG